MQAADSDRELPPGIILDEPEIRILLKPLALAGSEHLVDRLIQIAGRYLRPRQQAFLGSDPKSTKSKAAVLLEAATVLERELNDCSGEIHEEINKTHATVAESFGHEAHFDVHRLNADLTNFMQALATLKESIPEERGRPSKALRMQTLLNLIDAIEAASGGSVETTWAKSGTSAKNAFRGSLGTFILNFMTRLEPGASEASLVKDLRAVRQATKSGESSKK